MEANADTKKQEPLNDEVYVFPTTVGQKRFWSLESLEPGNPALNMPLAAKLTGRLDRAIFQEALDEVVRRHEILRSSFQAEGDEVVQVVHPRSPRPIAWIERRNLTPDQVTESTKDLMQVEALRPFNLAQGSLLRAAVASFSDSDHLLMLTMHHIVCDGWSNGVLLRELAEHYSRLLQHDSEQPVDLPLQYGDYAVWQKDWLGGSEAAEQLAYWRAHLGEELPVLNLPTDRPRGARPTFNGRIHTLLLPREISDGLRTFCQQEKITPFMFHLSAYVLLLHRYSGRAEFVVGSPAANRNQTELEGLIGLFANPLLFRFKLGAGVTFRQLLVQVRDLSLANFARQEYPFELVGEGLRGDHSRRGVPWLQAYFIFQKAFMQPQEMPELRLLPLRSTSAGAMFEWMLGVLERSEGVRLQLEYNTDLFDLETIDRALHDLQAITTAAIRHPEFLIEELELNRSSPTSFPAISVSRAAEPMIERIVTAFGGNMNANLLVCRETRLSLFDLRQYCDHAKALIAGHPGTRVLRIAIGTADPVLAIASAVAICSTGNTAVMLPTVPVSGAFDAVLSGSLRAPALGNLSTLETGSTTKPGLALRNDTAFAPDGEHLVPIDALCRQAEHVAAGLRVRSSDCVLTTAPLHTLLGWEEILVAWLQGATAVAEANCDTAPPVDVSVLLVPSAWWEEMLRRKSGPWLGICAKARVIAVDRDPVSSAAIKILAQPGPRLVQRFQPRELGATVVIQTLRPPMGNNDAMSARAPAHWIEGWNCTIVDRQGIRVPCGIPGRLQLQADWVGLASSVASSDSIRLRNDGSLEWLGATDDLYCTQSYSLELREIRDVACRHPGVWSAAVVPSAKSGTTALLLHVIPALDAIIPSAELKAFLAERLPSYMVPIIVVHDQMPLTPTGSIDWPALREPHWLDVATDDPAPTAGLTTNTGMDSAQDEMEGKLAELFGELLRLPNVDVRRSFFELGGHSLLGAKLFARIEKEFHQRLPLATLLTASSVRALARRLQQNLTGAAQWSCLVPIQTEGIGPKFFCIHGAGGNVLLYRDLARHMAPTVRFYGLQAQGLDGRSQSQTKISDMAELYLREILAEQPNGPYFLGGYCMGGNIAYEIAQLLVKQGKSVGLVALLDTYNLRKSRYTGSALARFRIWLQKVGFHVNTLMYLSMSERKVYLAEKLRMAGELIRGQSQALSRNRKQHTETNEAGGHIITFVQNANHIALTGHNPQPFTGNVTLFCPRKNYFSFDDPKMGWGELVNGRLEAVIVTANPHAMLIEPFVQKLAAELNQRIVPNGERRSTPGVN